MPPGRIWPGAAFAPPRAFVVPGSPPSDSRLALGLGERCPRTADSPILARDLCMWSRGHDSLRCRCNKCDIDEMA
jgi:hypothetical protein